MRLNDRAVIEFLAGRANSNRIIGRVHNVIEVSDPFGRDVHHRNGYL